MTELTERQRRFVDEYIITGVAETAAINAGYSETYARSQAHRILANVGIKKALKERNKQLDSEKIANMQEVHEFWANVLRDEENAMSERIKVSELIGKTNGAFLDRVEQTGDMGIKIEWVDDD